MCGNHPATDQQDYYDYNYYSYNTGFWAHLGYFGFRLDYNQYWGSVRQRGNATI